MRIAWLLAVLLVQGASAAPCTEAPPHYRGYQVGQVLVTSPIGFSGAGSYSRIAASLPLSAGAAFDPDAFQAGASLVARQIRDGFAPLPLHIVAVGGTLESCDDAARTLDVHYLIYSTVLPPHFSRAIEPLAGYDRTRGVYGGLRVHADAIRLDSAASNDSVTGTLSLVLGPWRLTADYRDVLSGGEKLVQSTLSAGYFGSTKNFRYGASLEGGNDGVDAKLLAGWSSGTWTASYGLELSNAFAKQVADLGYKLTLSPRPRQAADRANCIGIPHRALTVEARLGAGVILPFGALPFAERFFGGNQKFAFLAGSPWDVRGQPFLRSVTDNRLGGSGGTRFYALNVTVAKAGYARPLVPRELGTAEFVENLDFAIKTAEGELSDAYLAKDPQVMTPAAALDQIAGAIDALKTAVDPLPAALVSDLGRAARTVSSMRQGAVLGSVLAGSILPKVEADLTQLESGLGADAAARIAALRLQLESGRQVIARGQSDPAYAAARKRADAAAARDFQPVERILDTILYDLDIYSIAPVAIFDVARVWPSGAPAQGAIGGGLRLSVVNLDLTLGYALNPNPAPGLGRGAFFIQLDAADLFR
jgi:hypothetical protein